MNRKGLFYSSVALLALGIGGKALADLSYTQGSGTTIFDFVCFSTKHCGAHASITSTGGELFSPGTTPGQVTPMFNAIAPTQPPTTFAAATTSTGTVQNTNAWIANASNEPCLNKKTNVAISSTGTNIALVAGVANQKIYVCSFSILTSSGTSINLVEGINASCTATSTALAAVLGSTSPSRGLSIPDQGGLTYGSGIASVAATTYSSNYLCLTQSSSGTIAGNISVVQTSL